MWRGMEFHILGAATRKARAPNERLCRGTESKWLNSQSFQFFPAFNQPTYGNGLLVADWYENHHDSMPRHFSRPPHRLRTGRPTSFEPAAPVDVTSQSASISTRYLISDPSVQLLHCAVGSMLDQFHTGQGHCVATLYKWQMVSRDSCQCGYIQMMNQTLEFCPLTRFIYCLDLTLPITVQLRDYMTLQ